MTHGYVLVLVDMGENNTDCPGYRDDSDPRRERRLEQEAAVLNEAQVAQRAQRHGGPGAAWAFSPIVYNQPLGVIVQVNRNTDIGTLP